MNCIVASVLFFLSLFFFSSCVRKDQIFEFDTSDPYAFDIETKWSVVTDPYAVSRTDAGYEFSTTGNFRKGDVQRIVGEKSIKVGTKKEVWYCLENGWITSNAVKVYSNKLKALKAVSEMNLK